MTDPRPAIPLTVSTLCASVVANVCPKLVSALLCATIIATAACGGGAGGSGNGGAGGSGGGGGFAPRSDGGYYPFQVSLLDAEPTVVHMGERLLDAPAGKHGFLGVNSGRFEFEDETPFKVWGVNIGGSAAFPDAATAVALAGRLAKLGVNVVRVHWIDYAPAPDGIWNQDYSDLDEAQIDRLGGLLAELKRVGIYAEINLLSGWRMNSSHPFANIEHWPARSRYVIHFHPGARAAFKDMAKALLTRVEIDGAPLVDDPMLAQVQTINENVLGVGWASGHLRRVESERPKDKYFMQDELLEPLYQQWSSWLAAKYGSDAALDAAWQGLGPGESIAAGTVDLLDASAVGKISKSRLLDTQRFLFEVEEGFNKDTVAFLKQEVGVRSLITGSQFLGIGAHSIAARQATDYDNTHGYWNHPRGLNDKEEERNGGGEAVPQDSMLSFIDNLPFETTKRSSPLLRYARNKVAGRPLVISEWNTGYPSPYQYELGPLLVAYSSLQDWGGASLFTFALGGEELDDGPVQATLSMSGSSMAQLFHPLGALIFQRGDIAAAKQVVRSVHPPETLIEDAMAAAQNPLPAFHYGQVGESAIAPWTALVHRIERSFEAGAPSTPLPALETDGLFASDTGQLLADRRKQGAEIFTADSPMTQMVVGALSGTGPVEVSSMTIASETNGAFVLTSLDDAPLAESSRAVLLVLSDQRATGLQTQQVQHGLLVTDSGAAPMLLSHVDARVTIRSASLATATVHALGPKGERIGIVEMTSLDGGLAIDLHGIDSPWFEITTGG